jgi:hypothetical protein
MFQALPVREQRKLRSISEYQDVETVPLETAWINRGVAAFDSNPDMPNKMDYATALGESTSLEVFAVVEELLSEAP